MSGLALAVSIGDNESWRYWTAGASYAFNDMITADVTWHDTGLAKRPARHAPGSRKCCPALQLFDQFRDRGK